MTKADKETIVFVAVIVSMFVGGLGFAAIREHHDWTTCEAAGGDLWKDRKCLKTEEVSLAPKDISHG